MIKTMPKRKKCKKAKWLSEEALRISEKRREVKGKGEKERHTQLNAEFQRFERRALSSSVVPFSSCLQSFPASGSFQISQFFSSGGQSIGVSASTSVLPMNAQDWFLLRWTGCIFLQSKGLSTFSNTTVQKHVPLVSLIFLMRSLFFPILLFPSISLH